MPVPYRLYLPKEWAHGLERRQKAGVPAEIGFATKNEIALQQLETLLAEGAPKHYSRMGRPPVVPRRTRAGQRVSVKDFAHALPATDFQTISGRLAAVRVRHTAGNIGKACLHPAQWLLIEWPAGTPLRSNATCRHA